MKRADFAIGREFQTATGRWRCTDLGTRTVIAIKVSGYEDPMYDDPSWIICPPYAVAEHVFDEEDIKGCWDDRSPRGQDDEDDEER